MKNTLKILSIIIALCSITTPGQPKMHKVDKIIIGAGISALACSVGGAFLTKALVDKAHKKFDYLLPEKKENELRRKSSFGKKASTAAATLIGGIAFGILGLFVTGGAMIKIF